MRIPVLLMVLLVFATEARSQDRRLYNVDSLLVDLSAETLVREQLSTAATIYARTGLDTADISPVAFKLAYLEKMLVDKKKLHIRHRRRYRREQIITVVDLTKASNKRRLAIVDLSSGRLLFDTLVSQGSGKGAMRNDKYHVPTFFSNVNGSELSSLGLMGTRKARKAHNPCHLCQYAATRRHKDIVILEGLEEGINDNARKRDIVIHTTGSKDPRTVATGKQLHVKDENYRIAESECKCYHTDDGAIKGVAAYASACGLAENGGYIGQSNGCLVLPEDDHIDLMETIKNRTLIFTYSNVITPGYNYFESSPIIRQIIKRVKKERHQL